MVEMVALERLQQLLSQVGPTMETIERIDRVKEGLWVLGLHPDIVIEVSCQVETAKAVFSVIIGQVHGEQREKTYETMLLYNQRWSETDGVRLALDAPAGRIVLLVDVAVSILDTTILRNVIENVTMKTIHWRATLAGMGTVENQAVVPPQDGPFGIRV